MNDFIAGQRWISNSESELGLGLILESSFNRVSVLFLATGAKRIYARDNAPLTRVLFGVGDVIESTENEKITVTQSEVIDDLMLYTGINAAGESVQIEEIDLNHHLQFNKPQERLFTGQIDPSAWFLLRYETWRRLQQHQQSPVKGLQGGRTSLIAHQLFIAQQAANRFAPRIMLADEVGLGKTIEAGLILHQRLLNGLSQRVLIIVPETLLHQWLVEMLRRFNLRFSLFNEERCEEIQQENPFSSQQLVLAGQEFFTQYPNRAKQALDAGWDMVVVDEAHHLEWSPQQPSPEYQFVEALSLQTLGLILLTATPEQLGKESHFARLRLLDSDRFYSFDAFLEEESQFQPVAEVAKKLFNKEPLDTGSQAYLKLLLKNDKVDNLIAALEQPEQSDNARQQLTHLLLDHHGTGRILFRNSRQTVQGFPERNRHGYPLSEDADIKEDVYMLWLLEKLQQLGQQKAVLICHAAETVIKLEKALRQRGIAVAMFHEHLSIIERDRAAAYFADSESSAQLLICSEIGSEGRNFQFVHHLILFDLPTNPDLLQQRIGRLDRIGQKHTIELHIPYIENSPQAILFRWYDEGLNLFQHTSSAASSVAEQLSDELESFLIENNEIALEKFILKTKELNTEIETELHHGRDLLLELNSCRPQESEKIIQQLLEAEQQELWGYAEALFDCYGVDVEYHSPDCYIVRPSEHLRVSHFPCLADEDGLTLTVNREIALAREDMLFLTIEHPMMTAAMDLVLSSETGNACMSVVKHPHLKAGQYLLEFLFVVECSAPESLQINRFLPATPIRVLIDQNQEDLSAQIPHSSLIETSDKLNSEQISQFINSQKKVILGLLNKAEQVATTEMQTIIADSNKNMIASLSAEIKRLVRLQRINPSIKPEEIEQLKEITLLAHENINDARLKLDAIRFIVTN